MKEGESMPTIDKSIDIGAPVEKVFAYLSDPRNSPEWFVGMTEVTDVSGSGVGQHNRWTYTMIGIPFHGDSKLTEHVPNQRLVFQQEGGITSIMTFTFAPHDSGTKLGLDIDYTIPVPVLGKLAEKAVFKRNQREAQMSMENIKERLEV
ncbi:MAG: SRPBCC family protein [Deltaproteobacteria bacterium]|nr:SRPBCC family protein [Deltaproteobacteria bacterium]